VDDHERRSRSFPCLGGHGKVQSPGATRSLAVSDVTDQLQSHRFILSPRFVATYPRRILNVHPSLLPAFPGLEAQRQAWEHGVRVSGCTVHLVDEGLDSGPIVVQRAVPVADDDTPESLAARILVEEHHAYPEALRRLLTESWRVEGRRICFSGRSGKKSPQGG